MSDLLMLAYRRALRERDPSLVQLAFEADVLERYRGTDAYSIIRTDSAGRLRKQGGWSLDFGIAEGDAVVHASWRDLSNNLPEDDRDHWAAHAWGVVSNSFIRMQLSPGSCFDDGDVRPW
jgi:hypothetical protein